MKRFFCILFAVLFFALCLVPAAGMLVWGPSEAGANEVPAAAPALRNRDGSFNTGVLSDLTAYIGGRFAFRPELITAWAGLNAGLLRTSATQDVLLGSDGWLYFADTLDDYTGAAPMTDRELWCAARTLYLMQEYTLSRGGTFLFLAAPNKNSLYPEHMPDYTVVSPEKNVRRLFALLDDMGVAYADLFALFGEQDETLYFPGDSHWNGKGAALAADAVLAALGRDGSYFAGPFDAAETHRGDLYEMLYPAGKKLETDYTYSPGFRFTFSSGSTDADSITLTTACETGEGSLLLYRDSFGRNLYPYLADSFASARFSRKNVYDLTSLESGGCAAVELVERNLRYLNEYAPTFAAPERDLSPADALPAETACAVRAVSGAPDGLVKLSGTLTGLLPDSDSPVYVRADGVLYEAVPSPAGFSLCLPGAADDLPALEVYFTANGALVRAEALYEQ